MAGASSSFYLDGVQCHSEDLINWKENQKAELVSWQPGMKARFMCGSKQLIGSQLVSPMFCTPLGLSGSMFLPIRGAPWSEIKRKAVSR